VWVDEGQHSSRHQCEEDNRNFICRKKNGRKSGIRPISSSGGIQKESTTVFSKPNTGKIHQRTSFQGPKVLARPQNVLECPVQNTASKGAGNVIRRAKHTGEGGTWKALKSANKKKQTHMSVKVRRVLAWITQSIYEIRGG